MRFLFEIGSRFMVSGFGNGWMGLAWLGFLDMGLWHWNFKRRKQFRSASGVGVCISCLVRRDNYKKNTVQRD